MAQHDHGHGHGHGGGEAAEGPAEFVRNTEEIRGHLNASLTLVRQGRTEDAILHANHPPEDYLSVVLPPVEEDDPELASQIESTLNEAPEMAEGEPDAYADYIQNDAHPLLDKAVETVVSEEDLNDPTFQAQVNIDLLGRIDDEYTAAVAENGTVVLEGEYWDGRGFLNRIEARYPEISSEFDDDVGSDFQASLDELRTKYENKVPPSELKPTTARLRVLYEAGVGTDDAVIDDEVEAVRFMRNAEEVKGHLESSIRLKRQAGSGDASLHAGHPPDYLQALGPATYTADAATWDRLSEVSYATGERVGEGSADEYESYVRDEAFPAVDTSVEAAVPSEYRTTETRAQVAAELTDRLVEEYSAAVTEDGNVELEGEYWDGRGFLFRITAIHEEELSGEMSDETNEELTGALDELRSRYEDEVPPSELEPAAEEVRTILTNADFGISGDGEDTDSDTDGDTQDPDDGTDDGTGDESGTDGDTEDGTGGDGAEDDGGDGGQGLPGFTALVALVALLVGALLFVRE